MSFGKSKTYKGPDRRRSPRERVSLRADIILATGRRIPCQIVDRSATGMRIALTSMLGIPDRFDLQVESAEPVDVFVVRRQTGEEVGSGRRPSRAERRTDFGKSGDRKPCGEHPGSEKMKGNRGSDHRQPPRAVPLFRIGFHGDGEPVAVPSRISVRPASRARSPISVRRPWRTRRSASR